MPTILAPVLIVLIILLIYKVHKNGVKATAAAAVNEAKKVKADALTTLSTALDSLHTGVVAGKADLSDELTKAHAALAAADTYIAQVGHDAVTSLLEDVELLKTRAEEDYAIAKAAITSTYTTVRRYIKLAIEKL